MADSIKYLVKVDETQAQLAIIGRASYLNCRSVGDFFNTLIEKACKKVYMNFAECTGMDSTFLGMIAGLALKMRKNSGEVILANLSERNKELIKNMGIYRFVTITNAENKNEGNELETKNVNSENILKAHENLVEADPSNASKFEDVISFLKKNQSNS